MDQPFDTSNSSWSVKLGRRLFPYRGFVGVPVLLACLLLCHPVPAFSPLALVGWAFLLSGLGMRVWGVAGWYPPGVTVQTEGLITDRGPYLYTRNPRYLGNLAMGLGICAIARLPQCLPVFLLLWSFVHLPVVLAEEALLLKRYGLVYEAYLQKVPRFLGRVVPQPGNGAIALSQWLAALRAEKETWMAWCLMAALLTWCRWG